jgi:hypothetical protein
MSEFRIDDYIVGVGAFLLIFGMLQVALWLGRHAHVRDQEHKD